MEQALRPTGHSRSGGLRRRVRSAYAGVEGGASEDKTVQYDLVSVEGTSTNRVQFDKVHCFRVRRHSGMISKKSVADQYLL
jgi:hypothetical protein